MSFFDSDPTPEPPAEVKPIFPVWFRPPIDVLGASVAQQCLIASTPDVVALVTGLTAYPAGLSFNIEVRAHSMELHTGHASVYDGPGRVRFGLELEDGSAVFRNRPQVDDWPPVEDDRPNDGPVLMQSGGGGSDETFAFGLWLTPLPLGTYFTVVFEWPAANMPETRCVVSFGDLHQIALNAQQLW